MRQRLRSPLGAFLAYLVASFAFFGLRVADNPRTELVGFGADPAIFVWSFAWWPHALLNGHDPLDANVIWAPDGIDLSWVTTVPLVSLLAAPLTLATSPVVAYNVAAVLMPALAATSCFLLCRYLTGTFWPSLAGGFCFGFSAYMVGQTLGHMHLTSVFLIPLVALFIVQYVRGDLTWRQVAIRLAVALAALLWIGTEIFFTATVMLVGAGLLALALLPDLRRRLLEVVPAIVLAYAFAAVAAAPLLLAALDNFRYDSINRPEDWGADLVNFLVPTRLTAVGAVWAPPIAERFNGNDAESTAYLGLPILAAVVWFAVTRWRQPGSRFLVLAFAAGVLAALGTTLRVAGHELVWLPWDLVVKQQFFNHSLPVRFSMYVSLAAAVMVAYVVAALPRRAGAVLAALVVVSLVPRLDLPLWSITPDRPSFFTAGLYEDCLRPDENVFTVPYNLHGYSLLWQVDADFDIRMPGGYVRPGLPPEFTALRAVWELNFQGVIPQRPQLAELIRVKDVDRIVVSTGYHHDLWRGALAHLGPPSVLGEVAVYPRCGETLRASGA
ncbi:MAG: hypothetical protein ACRDNB_05615 [Gaiellaceae bacterium]